LALSLLGLHAASLFFTRLVLWKARRDPQALAVRLPRPTFLHSAGWFLLLMAGWCVHGLSLGLAIHAVSGQAFAWSQWPLWTAAMALGSVLGFAAVFAPGGLFVREGLLIEMLAPQIGGSEAVAAAVLLRVAGLAGEILSAGVLYYAIKPPPMEAAD
jgi:hypothetical protein